MGPLTWWRRVAPVGPATTALSHPPHPPRSTVPWELTVPTPAPASPCVLKVCILMTQKKLILEVKPFMLILISHLTPEWKKVIIN